MNKILIVDDDPKICMGIADILRYKGYQTRSASTATEGLELLKRNRFSAVLLDIVMPGISGIELLKEIHKINPRLPIIMVSGHGTIELAIKATQLGSYDFLEKPVDAERLLLTLKNAINSSRLLSEREQLIKELQNKYAFIGESKQTRQLFQFIDRIAPSNAKVLITGETGVGKELVARAIHLNSSRAKGNFVKVNCAAIPKDLIESELFGHKKGAFTGALEDHKGKFMEADGGTIFLDEIGELENRAQAKLLQVLQDSEVTRVGDNIKYKIDVRVIAATNKELHKEIKKGNFREDLYFRLNVAHIHIPPLRERKADISLLVDHYVKIYCDEYNKPPVKIPDQTMEILTEYDWPGNVRELKNTIEKLIIFSRNSTIQPGQVMDALHTDQLIEPIVDENQSLNTAKNEFEKQYIWKILKKNNWKISEAAKILGIDRTNLFKKMKKHGISKQQ